MWIGFGGAVWKDGDEEALMDIILLNRLKNIN